MMGQTDGRTDTRQLHRPCSAYYAGGASIANRSASAQDGRAAMNLENRSWISLLKGKGSLELIPVLCSQPAGDVSHKPGGRLPLLSARPEVILAKEDCYQFCYLVNRGRVGVDSLPKTVTRQRRNCDLNPGPSAAESSTLTTRIPSHPYRSSVRKYNITVRCSQTV